MAAIDLPIALSATAPARPLAAAAAAARLMRIYYVLLAAIGLAAFVLNVDNRLTSAGLFFFTPPLDLIPPLSAAKWSQAYSLHQQDPVFTACGGSESLEDFKLLYMWNWFARASGLMFAAAAAIGCACAIAVPRFRAVLPRLAALGLLGAGYLVVSEATRVVAFRVADLARYNGGQYRHAVDLVFATAALAVVLVAAVRPIPAETRLLMRPGRSANLYSALFIIAILLEVAFGAMFATRNAAAVWTTWPGYEGRLLPPLDQLTSFSPLWLNFAVNQYTIQLVHRALSIALVAGALAWLVAAALRDPPRVRNALALLALLIGEMAAGIAALLYGTPAWLSIAHQVGAVFLLAGAFLALRRPMTEGRRTHREVRRQPSVLSRPYSVLNPRSVA
jgi:cytochrome c oxidase assembly protein subunit 15